MDREAMIKLRDATANFAQAVENANDFGTIVSANGHDGLVRAEKRLMAALEEFHTRYKPNHKAYSTSRDDQRTGFEESVPHKA